MFSEKENEQSMTKFIVSIVFWSRAQKVFLAPDNRKRIQLKRTLLKTQFQEVQKVMAARKKKEEKK